MKPGSTEKREFLPESRIKDVIQEFLSPSSWLLDPFDMTPLFFFIMFYFLWLILYFSLELVNVPRSSTFS